MRPHSGVTFVPAVAADNPWRIWQARGGENDRRREARLRILVVVATTLAVVAFAVAMVS